MTAVQAQPRLESRTFSKSIPLVLIAALFIVYSIQLRSPLRVSSDALLVLRLTAVLTDGKPYLDHGVRPIFPIGVPLTYSLMERAGLANALGFGVLNLICLVVGAYATWIICRALGLRRFAAPIILISFSHFALLVHSVLPLTEIPYLMASLACVALLEWTPSAPRGERTLAVVLTLLCLVGAVFARRVGVALFPVVIYAWMPSRKHFVACVRFLRARKIWIIPALLAALLAVIGAMLTLRWLMWIPDFIDPGSLGAGIAQQCRIRLIDFGELFVNATSSALGRFHPVTYFAGPILAILIGIGLWRSRARLRPTHIYFISYFVVLALWPYEDVRFWAPVLPIITMLVFEAVVPWMKWRVIRVLVIAYLAVYALTVMVSIVFTTRITFAGPRFPEIYGSPETRRAYERAWTCPYPDAGDEAAYLVHRYGMVNANQCMLRR